MNTNAKENLPQAQESRQVVGGGLLQEVQNDQTCAKVGIFGSQGSGKTTTAALLALAVSKTYHNGAPVAMMDTENGSDYLKPIFDAEGVKLLVRKSGAFTDMVKVLREAEKLGCCAFLMDSVTHTWRELTESYSAAKARAYNISSYRLQFQDWGELKTQWAMWTYAFLNSPLHCFISGRAGYEYEYQEGQDGKKELIKGNSKMKAEGEFGYEPSLLIEMDTERRQATKKHHGGQFTHIAYVLKDRARSLNGRKFEYPDMNAYKSGGWKKLFADFQPHFAFLNLGGQQRAILPETSEELFDEMTGSNEARQRQQAKKIALEEIENVIGVVLWPGTSADMKKLKLAVLQRLFGVRSWTAVEGMHLKQIEDGLWALQEYEHFASKIAGPSTEEETLTLLGECMDRVKKPGYAPGRERTYEAITETKAVANG